MNKHLLNNILTLGLIMAIASLNTQCQTANRNVTESNSSGRVTSKEAQTTGFVEKVFENSNKERMRYLVFVPKDYDKEKKYPLVLWLHGGGSRGDDLKLLMGHGDKSGLGFFARSDNQEEYPSIVVAPQCPSNRFWGDPISESPTSEMRLVLQILDKVQIDYSIDSQRLYAIGISLGGFGTWDIIGHRPTTFAAAVPICGGGNVSRAPSMTKTAIWAFHGDKDESVNVNESRKMIAAIKNAGGTPKYTEYKGVGHNSWDRAFAEPELLSWMFAQSR